MKPGDFEKKTTDEITSRVGTGYQGVAGPVDLGNGYQGAAYLGINDATNRAEFVLHVADTDPASDAFAEQVFPRAQVGPEDDGYHFEGVRMEAFQGLGDLTVPYPE